VFALLGLTTLFSSGSVAVNIGRRHRRKGVAVDDFRHPLHALTPVRSRFIPTSEPLAAVVVEPDLIVTPTDDNDVHVDPTIVEMDHPLHDDVEIQVPMNGRLNPLSIATDLGLNESELADMTTRQKIHALLPVANKEVRNQVQAVAELAADLFKDAQDLANRTLTEKIQSKVEIESLRKELAESQDEITSLRKTLRKSKNTKTK